MKTLDALIATLKQAKEELAKAIKPGPTLDYSKINPKPDREAQEAAAPVIDYGNNRMKAPKVNAAAGAAERAAAVRAKLDAESKETALETINRKAGRPNKVNKADEPHKDDPKHEEKEKKKAAKIKEKAQELIDMHKQDPAPPPPPPNAAAQSIMSAFGRSEDMDKGCDVIKADQSGQWYLQKDNSVKPFGQNIYNATANIKRKANRTGEEVEGVGRNAAVHNYTTSGSSMSAAHEAAQAKEMKAKAKASVRTMKDMSPEELAAIQSKQGKK